MVIMHPIQAHF